MQEFIQSFGVDWKLLLAQAVNFFVLLFILHRFAYRPLFSVLKKRKEEIEKGILYTRKAKEDLEKADVIKAETLKKAHVDALAVVSEAEQAGKKRKGEIVVEAQKKAEAVVHEAKKLIREERAKMDEAVYRDAREVIRRSVEKVIGALPDNEKNSLLIEDALRALKKS